MTFLRDFLENIRDWNGYPDNIAGKYCPSDFEPYEFLDFAEQDLKTGASHAAGNAVVNTKKALETQIDCFLIDYGLQHLAQSWGAAKKIELIGDVAILRPSILKKVNDLRNKWEHQNKIPSVADAENAIEIVDLFIGATDGLLSPVREGVVYTKKNQETGERIQFYMNRFQNVISAASFQGEVEGDSIGAQFDQYIVGLLKKNDETARAMLNTYLLLLTLMIHCHKLDSKQPEKFFQKSKYVRLFLNLSPSED